jgi:hypothetical protein
MLDDPLSLLGYAVWTLALGMWPVALASNGFLFGACSACCNQCRNDTCDGFDLEEAFGGTRTAGAFSQCFPDDLEDMGGVIRVTGSAIGRIHPGCRVYGNGIAPNAIVTEVDDVPARSELGWTFSEQGCCNIEYSYKNCPGPGIDSDSVFTSSETVARTRDECDAREEAIRGQFVETCPEGQSQFGGPAQLVSLTKSFTACEDCNGQPVGSVRTDNLEPYTRLAQDVTISPAPMGSLSGCLSFCGSGGMCGPFDGKSGSGDGFGPYGAGVVIPGDNRGCCNIEIVRRECDENGNPTGEPETSFEASLRTAADCAARAAQIGPTACGGQSPFGGGGIAVTSVTPTWTAGVDCNGGLLEGSFIQYPSNWHRSCVRWVCRCYEGTGKKNLLLQDVSVGCCTVTYTYRECDEEGMPVGDEIVETYSDVLSEGDCELYADSFIANSCELTSQHPVSVQRNWVAGYDCNGQMVLTDEPAFPDPYDWYEVVSTSAIGGGTTNGLDLGSELEAALASGIPLEHEWLFGYEGWEAADGEIKCIIYAFVFYGPPAVDAPLECSSSFVTGEGKTAISADNVYKVYPCSRCN